MAAYYNEIDPFAAQWLRNLIAAGHIAPGDVDERSIEDVHPDDLRSYTQCHFFAGIGVWSYALRRASWADDRPVWTGSCPCQPFSAAGKGTGFDDERHLWPAWHHFISECRPAVIFGEQVASKDTGPWIDLVHDDMEALGHAFGAVPFPSASVGAPHIRDRLYWVAHAEYGGRSTRKSERPWPGAALSSGVVGELADSGRPGNECGRRLGYASAPAGTTESQARQWQRSRVDFGNSGAACRVAYDSDGGRRKERSNAGWQPTGDRAQGVAAGPLHGGSIGAANSPNNPWDAADWLLCRDGKWRPVEPGTFPLAHGATSRVGRLRAYGNAINAFQAQIFIEASMK